MNNRNDYAQEIRFMNQKNIYAIQFFLNRKSRDDSSYGATMTYNQHLTIKCLEQVLNFL